MTSWAEAKPESTDALSSILMSTTDPERGDDDAEGDSDRDAESILSCLRRIPTSRRESGVRVARRCRRFGSGIGQQDKVLRTDSCELLREYRRPGNRMMFWGGGRREWAGESLIKDSRDVFWVGGGCGMEAALEMQPGVVQYCAILYCIVRGFGGREGDSPAHSRPRTPKSALVIARDSILDRRWERTSLVRPKAPVFLVHSKAGAG